VNSSVVDTTDQTLYIQQMLAKKEKEYNAALQGLVIDIKVTCDSATGEVLRNVLILVCL
jgi:hypothetical protein